MTAKTNEKRCFTIMPFGGWFDVYYMEIFVPAIKEANMKPNRADDLYRPGNIVNDIWNYTKKADVILADLTGKNPNVFYELGLAHAITKPAVLVTSSMDDVPFDLRSLRIIVYDKNTPDWGLQLKEKITKALIETLENPEEAIPTTFLETTKVKKIEISPEEKEVLELKNEINSIKREVRTVYNPTRTTEIEKEAIYKIREFIKLGMTDYTISAKLDSYDLPIEWKLMKIREIRNSRSY